jgi:hypothetical protein
LARVLLRLAIVPFLLVVSLVAVASSYGLGYGTVTITSIPYFIRTGDEPSVSVHAEWSGLSGMVVRIGLKVRNDYGAFSSEANITSYDTDCKLGCVSNFTDGKTDAVFSLTAEPSTPGSSIYLYPTSLTVYATLSQCPNESSSETECTVIAASEPATIIISTIGEPPSP